MLTTPRPATSPANATTPAPAARTSSASAAPRSTPRCPGSHGCGGGSNPLVTTGRPASGHHHRPGAGPAPVAGRSTGTAGHGADDKEAFAGSDLGSTGAPVDSDQGSAGTSTTTPAACMAPGWMGTAVRGEDQGAVAGRCARSAGHGVERTPAQENATAIASDITRGSSAVMAQP